MNELKHSDREDADRLYKEGKELVIANRLLTVRVAELEAELAALIPFMNIEDRLKPLEVRFGYPGCVHGTTLSRSMNPVERGPLQWALALGPLQCKKVFFVGNTVEEVLSQAEEGAILPSI